MFQHPLSIGGWCLVSRGGDPFGDFTRQWTTEEGLQRCQEAGIQFVSFHDRDLWSDDASGQEVEEKIRWVGEVTRKYGVHILNFTPNLFSNPALRSGAFSSPFPAVREAAVVKALRAVDYAAQLGAESFIFWGGREGSDGAYEQDPGLGLKRYMEGIRICVVYAQRKGYKLTFTIEPKLYEPRLLGLYAGSGSSASSAIRTFLPDLIRLVKVNPEYPQHVAMLGLDPWMELGQLLQEEMLARFIHFGGQIAARMDCDMPPGFGGNVTSDFALCNLLHEKSWLGVVEFDCRPLRTTTTTQGLALFLRHCVSYWRMLENKVEVYQNDPLIQRIRYELEQQNTTLVSQLTSRSITNGGGIVEAFSGRDASSGDLQCASSVSTDAIEAHMIRLLQIVTGTEKEGAAVFNTTRWA